MFRKKQEAQQDTERLFQLKRETRFSRLRRKKWFWPVVIVVIVLLCILLARFVLGRRMRSVPEGLTATQSSTVERGDVSTTISGTGTLANGDGTDIELYDGLKITKVLVSEGDEVKKGQTLARVKKASAAKLLLEVEDAIDSVEDELDELDSDDDLEQVVLEAQLSELKTTRSDLNDIYESGAIKATKKGIISTVSVEAGDTVGQSSASTSTDSTTASSGSMMMTASQQVQALAQALSAQDAAEPSVTLLSTDTQQETGEQMVTTISDLSGLAVTTPRAGEKPQQTLDSAEQYSAEISWNCTGTFQAGKSYTATIVLTAADGYTFGEAEQYMVSLDDAKSTDITVDSAGQEGNQLTVTAKYQIAKASSDITKQTDTDNTDNSNSSDNSNNSTVSGNTGDITAASTDTGTVSSGSATVSSGSTASGSSDTASASSTASDSTDSTEFSQSSIFTLSSDDEVEIEISVDELDINSVAEGDTATVTMDALEGQEFEGTVSEIGTTATTSSGSSKYTVTITVEKEDGMLEGMSASAIINIEQVTDVLVIPVSAVQERGDTSYVYTEQDSEGNLSGEVEIETGLSNGTQVEVTSGLSEGDTVYYTDAGTDFSADSAAQSDMPGGGDFSGQMPSDGGGGGQMPSGGGPQGGGPSE